MVLKLEPFTLVGENVGDMIDDVEIGMQELFNRTLTGEFSNIVFYNISIYKNNVEWQLNELEYDDLMEWLSGAEKITPQQEVHIINEEWRKLYDNIFEKDKKILDKFNFIVYNK